MRADGPQPAARVAHILRQVCGALAEAHGVGLIHRDVKPANIILSERGGMPDVAKVVDFGLVKSFETSGSPVDIELTSANLIVGTPLYISPEAVGGDVALDGRSDLYALGAVGYFLLTGRPCSGRRAWSRSTRTTFTPHRSRRRSATAIAFRKTSSGSFCAVWRSGRASATRTRGRCSMLLTNVRSARLGTAMSRFNGGRRSGRFGMWMRRNRRSRLPPSRRSRSMSFGESQAEPTGWWLAPFRSMSVANCSDAVQARCR